MIGSHPTDSEIAELYRRYAAPLTRIGHRLIRDSEEVHDLVQESFARYLRQRTRWSRGGSPFAVLYRILTNAALDRLRRQATEQRRQPDLVTLTAPSGMELGRIGQVRDLAILTRGLSETELAIAVMYHVEGYTQEEIARTEKLSRRTIGKALQKVEQHVRRRATRLGYLPVSNKPERAHR